VQSYGGPRVINAYVLGVGGLLFEKREMDFWELAGVAVGGSDV
jgi:hypothetical protein